MKDGCEAFNWEEFLIVVAAMFVAFILPLIVFGPMLIRSPTEKTG